MPLTARYLHTNLIAKDWRTLAAFYQDLFGCTPVPPERDLVGEQTDAGTGVPGAHIRGLHLRLPGYGENGPTIEIFSYNILEERGASMVNTPGFAHIAFSVEDVIAARITWCYVTDPEGNIVELQARS